MSSDKEHLLPVSTPSIIQVNRKPTGTTSMMRKYQQLILVILSVVSLVAFLFYKHEYDRLRYTLEYLEMFGNVPSERLSSSLCDSGFKRKLKTSPHSWITVNPDLAVYSVYWEESFGIINSKVRILALVRNSFDHQSEIDSQVMSEWVSKPIPALCKTEVLHQHDIQRNNASKLVYLICHLKEDVKKSPTLIRIKDKNGIWSPLLPIEESESWKSVANVSCACVFSTDFLPASSLRLVEFISHHRNLGIENFVFYGTILSPFVRKLLDKYGEDVNLFYEEKSFNVPKNFTVDEEQVRLILTKDCIYRHRDIYENVIVLKTNEFILPRSKITSLQEVLHAVRGDFSPATSLFSFNVMQLCLDETHPKYIQSDDLLLEYQSRSISYVKNLKISLLRPHLLDEELMFRSSGLLTPHRVPSSVAVIYSFEDCPKHEKHSDRDHVGSSQKFVELIKASLLFRKWKIGL